MIIGLHGAQQSGKDTVADILVEDHGFTKFAFADRLREMVLALDPVIAFFDGDLAKVRLSDIVSRIGWDLAKKVYPEVRRTLQRFGTEVIRDYVSENYFADVVAKAIARTPLVVVSDMRFASEYYALQHAASGSIFSTWWVSRPGAEYKPEEHARSESWHPSCYEMLVNDGGMLELRAKIATKMESMKAQLEQ